MKHKRHEYQAPQKCRGKNCYRSTKEASEVALEQELRDINHSTNISIYHCQFCGHYHLTKDKPSEVTDLE